VNIFISYIYLILVQIHITGWTPCRGERSMFRSYRGNLPFVLAMSSNALATMLAIASRHKTGVPMAALVSGSAVLSIIGIFIGMRSVHRSADTLDRHLASVKNGMAEPEYSPESSRRGPISQLAGGIEGFLAHIQGRLRARQEKPGIQGNTWKIRSVSFTRP